MATIILVKDGVMLQKVPLLRERITIGRRTYNDVVIDAPNISAEHAAVVTSAGKSYFEDLQSTNGSQINGRPITKHSFADGDLINFGKYAIQYQADVESVPMNAVVQSDLLTGQPSDSQRKAQSNSDAIYNVKPATIQILNGHNVGKMVEINESLTTIGHPNIHVAALTCTKFGYSLSHIQGIDFPSINGKCIGWRTQALANGDLIDLADTKILFIS